MAKTKKPMILEIATIPEAPNNLEIYPALRKIRNDTKHKVNIAAIINALSVYSG